MHLVDVILPAICTHLVITDDLISRIALDFVFGIEVNDELPIVSFNFDY